jgi:hypothetical protein
MVFMGRFFSSRENNNGDASDIAIEQLEVSRSQLGHCEFTTWHGHGKRRANPNLR